MCVSENMNEAGEEIPIEDSYILSPEQLKSLALLNFDMAHGKKKTAITELFKPTNEQISFALSLSYSRIKAGNSILAYGNLLGSHLFSFFGKGKRRKILPNEVFSQIMDNLFKLSKVKREMDETQITQLVQKTLEQIVDTKENFEKFVNANFRLGEEDIARYNDIGLNFIFHRQEPIIKEPIPKRKRVRLVDANK